MSSKSSSHRMSSKPWSRIRSKISNSDVSSIRQKFYIPDEYEIIVPGPNDSIDNPPERCLAFHVGSLKAGLRFPLSRDVEVILSGLKVCPAQLVPNSYRQILSFIILTRYFQVDPSFVNFRSLISIVSATNTGVKGFFFLKPNSHCKLLRNQPLSLGHWKYKFIYVKSPENKSWGVPTRWVNITRCRLSNFLETPSWGQDFISNRLTVTFYDSAEILKEDVLVLAGLSPAPIETTRSLGMAVQESMIFKAMREQRDEFMSRSQPVIQEPSDRKESRSGGLSKRARAEDLSGEKVPTAEWLQKARKIVGDMSKNRDGSSSHGDNVVFKPAADNLEKYKYTLRDDDQIALADLPLTKLEDIAAYHSSAINAVSHHLLLRAACSKNELRSCERKLNKANQKANDQVGLKELEQSLNDTKHENMSLRKRLEELQMNRSRECMESFEVGRAEGRQEFVESEEYRSAMKRAREEGIRDFMKSNTYATLVAKKAARYVFDGFEKCLSQAKKLGAFRMGFDIHRFDPCKDGNLEDPVFDDKVCPDEDDEFTYLL